MLLAFSVAPSGSNREDHSVGDAVAAAVKVVRESGLPNRTTSMFTEIEGSWDDVFDVVKRATEAVGPYGSRISLVIKADIRPGYDGEIDGKVERLESAIDDSPLAGSGMGADFRGHRRSINDRVCPAEAAPQGGGSGSLPIVFV